MKNRYKTILVLITAFFLLIVISYSLLKEVNKNEEVRDVETTFYPTENETNINKTETQPLPVVDITRAEIHKVDSGEKPYLSSNGYLIVAYRRGLNSVDVKLFDGNLKEVEYFTPVKLKNFEVGSHNLEALSNSKFIITYSKRDLNNRKDEKLKAVIMEGGDVIKELEVDRGVGDNLQEHHEEGGATGGQIASNNEVLIVWHDTRNGPFQLFGRWFDIEVNPLGEDFRIDKGGIGNPSVIWPEEVNTGKEQSEVTAQKVSLNPFGEAFVAWADERDETNTPAKSNRFRILNKDGFLTDEVIIAESGAGHIAVGFFDNKWIVVWKEDYNPLFGMDVEGERNEEIIDKEKMQNSNISLFLNVYDRKGNLLKEKIRVDTAGKVYVGRGMGFVEKSPSVSNSKDNFLVSWVDYRNNKYEVFVRIFNKDFIPGQEFLVGEGWKPDTVYENDNYYLSYQKSFDNIYLAKLFTNKTRGKT